MSVEKQKKYSNKKRIFYKNLHIIIKGRYKNMKLTKKQKKQIAQKLNQMFFEFLGCLAVSAVFILFMIYALEH